jgi:hypothetical protein
LRYIASQNEHSEILPAAGTVGRGALPKEEITVNELVTFSPPLRDQI